MRYRDFSIRILEIEGKDCGAVSIIYGENLLSNELGTKLDVKLNSIISLNYCEGNHILFQNWDKNR